MGLNESFGCVEWAFKEKVLNRLLICVTKACVTWRVKKVMSFLMISEGTQTDSELKKILQTFWIMNAIRLFRIGPIECVKMRSEFF